MPDASAAAAAANQLTPMWAVVLPWVLGAIGATALALSGAFTAMWRSKESSQAALVTTLKSQALSSETARIAADQAKAAAEMRYQKLNGEYKATARALRKAVRQHEANVYGAPLSLPPPEEDADEPTGRFFVDTHHDRALIDERDRERSIGNQVHLRLPPPSEALALEAFGTGPKGSKAHLPRDAGGEDYRARKADEIARGIQTPTQALPPYRGRQDTKRDRRE